MNRENDGECGPSGKLFEERDDFLYRISKHLFGESKE